MLARATAHQDRNPALHGGGLVVAAVVVGVVSVGVVSVGSVCVGGALNLPMLIVTVVPGLACVLPSGIWLRTWPSWLWSLVSTLLTATLKPEFFSVCFAEPSSKVVTSGTAVVVGPFETVNVIVEPFGCSVSPAGLCPVTVPFGSFDSCCTGGATAKPAPWRAEIADSTGCPITGGTATGATPFETLIRTTVPSTTREPGRRD